jgi:chemotaxis protein MotB
MNPGDDPLVEIPRATAPGWMITFADLLSLLLTFFVLVFATTAVGPKDWQRVVQPISTYLSGRTIAAPQIAGPAPPPARLDLAYVSTLLERLVGAVPALTGAGLERREHDVVLTLPQGREPADWVGGTPSPLADLARLLDGLDNRVEVVVHGGTDASPHARPEADWRRALGHAQDIAAALNRLGRTRPVAATGSADLPGGPQALRIEIAIGENAAEVEHGAP